MMKIGVIGASGVIGHRLVPRLLERGATVRCIVRPGSHRSLPCGAHEVVAANILDEGGLAESLHGLDTVVNLATRIPCGRGDWRENDQIRTDGTRCLLSAIARQEQPCRLVQQSIAMLHQSVALASEDDEVCGQGILASALQMEAAIQTSHLDWVLIRGSAVYGPGTARDDGFFAKIRNGEVAMPLEPNHYLSLVHVDDLASAFVTGLTVSTKRAYIASDNMPMTYRALFAALSPPETLRSEASPLFALPSFRVSNRRLQRLGWNPIYPDVFTYLNLRADLRRDHGRLSMHEEVL